MKSKFIKEMKKGILKENPVLILLLGFCPTLAVTTSAINGLGMGLATFFVLFCSNFIISLFRNLIPDKIRIPSFVVVIASFVTIVDLVMNAYLPDLHKELGLFIPLIVVNCIILGRAEAFASKNNVFLSIADAIGMGIGFTLALFILGSIREILGSGTLLSLPLFGDSFEPALVMVLPPGAFITLGFLLAFLNKLSKNKKQN